ncbi:MAG: hypothetical protein ACSNEK_04425 [Parachlamydiaceae bacterium]
MKKQPLKSLALLGLVGGLLAIDRVEATQAILETTTSTSSVNTNQELMSEEELLKELNDEGKRTYNSLDAEGKLLARKVASQICSSYNECKGLNRCRTEKNACKGQGSCKGQSTCSIDDKNDAVKLVADKMAKKRAQAQK